MNTVQLSHRGLRRAQTTNTRIVFSIVAALASWAILFCMREDIWRFWFLAFSEVSVLTGIPSAFAIPHGTFSVNSVAFIPKAGLYRLVAGTVALVTLVLSYTLRKIALPASITLFCVSIVFGVTQLFTTSAHLHALYLGRYLGTLFQFSFKVIPLIIGMLCVTGFIMPGRASKQAIWFFLGASYLIALPPVLVTVNALVLSIAGAGLLPFTALLSWFVISVSSIAIFSQIASQ